MADRVPEQPLAVTMSLEPAAQEEAFIAVPRGKIAQGFLLSLAEQAFHAQTARSGHFVLIDRAADCPRTFRKFQSLT